MNSYVESKKEIEAIRNKCDEAIFRMAISLLMDVGIRHLTKKDVIDTCEQIMQRDDSKSFMTNEFQCSIVQTAYELAQIPHTYLLVYIQREVVYELYDGVMSYDKAIRMLKKCINIIEENEDYDNAETYRVLHSIGFLDCNIESLGFEYLLEESEDY